VWIQEKNHRLASLMARQECILELMPREEIKDLFVQRDKKSLFVAWELIFYALWHQIYIQGRDPIPDTLAMLART
jgi:asparagine synthase (glutamine-hydrolysing)